MFDANYVFKCKKNSDIEKNCKKKINIQIVYSFLFLLYRQKQGEDICGVSRVPFINYFDTLG